ncbi:MFS transporter [Peribacillus sp. FSL E2-0159]|uniref:MFS transporter n=1 Tax=Peribacillus sp. FSL E2-0159 TaxID=2975289 RepID=UPI00315A0CB7
MDNNLQVATPEYTDKHELIIQLEKTPLYSWWVLVVSLLCFMTSFISLAMTSVFGTIIQQDWGISATKLSLLTTAFMFTFTVVPIFAGNWAARIGVKKIVLIGMLINILSALLLPVVGQAFGGLLFLKLLQGCTGGLMNSTLAAHASLWFPKNKRGLATGILMGFLGIGFTLASFIGPILLQSGMTWQMANLWMVFVPSFVSVLLFLFTVKDFQKAYPFVKSMDDFLPPVAENKKSTRFDHLPKPGNMKEVMRNRRVWFSGIYGAGTAVTLYGLTYALPLYLEQSRGLSLVVASSILGTTFFFKLVAAPIGGMLSDKVFKSERYQTNVIGALLAGTLILLLPTVPNSILTIYLCIMFTAASLYGGTYWTWAPELSQPQATYQTGGFIVTISNIGGLVIAPILGIIIDTTGSVTMAMAFIGVVTLVSIIAAYFSKI